MVYSISIYILYVCVCVCLGLGLHLCYTCMKLVNASSGALKHVCMRCICLCKMCNSRICEQHAGISSRFWSA